MLQPKELSVDELRRFRAYDRLNAISDILTIAVVMFFSYFLPTPLFYQIAIYGLTVLMAAFSLLWHTLIPEKYIGPTKLLLKGMFDTLFVTLLIQYTGTDKTPFFFLYYVILMSIALSLGVRYTFIVAGIMSISYIVMSGVIISSLIFEPKAFIYIWANISSLWLVGYMAAFLADEAEKARKQIAEARDKVENYSKIDWLTGLYNMRHFDSLAAQEMARAERYARPMSVLMLDSDHLKVVNDTFGHQVGDRLISDMAKVITAQCRVSDTVIRYGGDEFIVLLPETDGIGARYLGERIRAAMELYDLPVDRKVPATVSVGVASFPQDARGVMGLLARADAALYHSKAAGRNRVTVYSPGMRSKEEIEAENAGDREEEPSRFRDPGAGAPLLTPTSPGRPSDPSSDAPSAPLTSPDTETESEVRVPTR
jgi:diguanylate cyclase (GGDEF)-like protein